MNRRTIGIMATIGVAAASLAGTSSAENLPGRAALDASLRAARLDPIEALRQE